MRSHIARRIPTIMPAKAERSMNVLAHRQALWGFVSEPGYEDPACPWAFRGERVPMELTRHSEWLAPETNHGNSDTLGASRTFGGTHAATQPPQAPPYVARNDAARFKQIFVRIVALIVCSCWIVGLSEPASGGSFSYPRLAQLTDGDEFYTQLGKAAVERGDNYRAVRLLTSALKKGGGAQAFKYRAQAYERLGLQEKASADVERYIQLKPRDPWGYTKRGAWYNLASKHDKALGQFLKAVQLDPSFAATHLGLGITYVALERHESAVHEFQKVLDLEPDNKDAFMNLGVALMLSGRVTEAREVLSKALQSQDDAKWKGRIERWLASLPPVAEASGPSTERSTGDSKGMKRAPNSVEDSGGLGTRYDPVPGEKARAGHNRPKEQDRISSKDPENQESEGHLSSDTELTKSETASSQPSPLILTGQWNTEYRGIEIGVNIRQVGDQISGVMTVDGPLVGSNSYPFNGTFSRGILRGHSREGHTFEGRINETGRVVGKFVIKGGPTVPVNFKVRPAEERTRRGGN